MTATGIAIRVAVLLMAVLVATWITQQIRDSLDLMVMPHNEIMVHRSIMLATGVFIVLLAIPFVPGAEIGLTMLTVFGADIAPLVYGATVTALMLAYLIGRFVPPQFVVRGLHMVHLNRAAASVAETIALPREDRLAQLTRGNSPRLLRLTARYRYVAILVAINLPGNFLIGGGGGIALVAGISGLFAPLPFLVTVALAVCPVPLAVMAFGG